MTGRYRPYLADALFGRKAPELVIPPMLLSAGGAPADELWISLFRFLIGRKHGFEPHLLCRDCLRRADRRDHRKEIEDLAARLKSE